MEASGGDMTGSSPTILRRRLGRTLRDLRERTGLTGDEAGRAVERSGSWISRVEAGRVGVRSRELIDLLRRYGMADPGRTEELVALADGGRRRGWWSKYAEALSESYLAYIGMESAARSINGYYDRVVPGLLQTEEYCRATIVQSAVAGGVGASSLSPERIETRVEARMARQQRLARDPPGLRFLLDEAVLHRTIGGKTVLRDQLQQLLTRQQAPHIDLRVVPFIHGDRIISVGQFAVMSFLADPDVAWLESPDELTQEEGADGVEMYRRVFELLYAAALDPEATQEVIEKAGDRLH